MILTNCNQEAFYTLTRDGSLIQISNYPGSTKWLEAVDRTTEMLEKANADNSILYLYRGENRAMFFAKTGINNFAYDENPYYDRFFIIGSKAKSYLEHKNNDIPDLKQFDRVSKTHYIFHQLQEISKNPTFNRMLEYFNTSSSFADFKTTLDNIHDADHRLTIENLFLAFIHTLSSTPEDIHAHSVLISSSRNYEVAKSFSDTGFVIVFWLSNPIQNQAIDYYNIDIYNQLLSRYDLPVINKVHFPDESEVTLFSAIFPHNIYYVHDISRDILVFNPYILDTDIDQLIERGINVDQSNFNDNLKGIYSRSIWRTNKRLVFEEDA